MEKKQERRPFLDSIVQFFYESFTISRQIDLQNFEEYKKQVHNKIKKSKKEELIEKEFEALKMSLKLPTGAKHIRHSGFFQSFKLDKKIIKERPPIKRQEIKSTRSISTTKDTEHKCSNVFKINYKYRGAKAFYKIATETILLRLRKKHRQKRY